ncbi:uncharacterized protein LOC112090514 [Morus notabilis]|uniref:uncharacterized protein LOC112090514 n=1 Tax=Morus notabilis TaxID=981085 RepID=UPI000CED1B69|nr:uncharacterized protein LOC112090514 [Morus notabilis]
MLPFKAWPLELRMSDRLRIGNNDIFGNSDGRVSKHLVETGQEENGCRRIDLGAVWTLFNEQYFPQSYREEKALEFMSLLQGDMSIREYEAKFNDLSRFAPSLVESEHMRCLKFEKGLKNSVMRSLVALRLRNFQDLVAAATRVEQDNLAYHQSKEEAGRVSVSYRPSVSGGPQRSGRRNRNQGQMVGGMASGGSSSSGSDRNAPYGPRCHHCGQVGHIRRNCPNRPPAQQAQSDTSYS